MPPALRRAPLAGLVALIGLATGACRDTKPAASSTDRCGLVEAIVEPSTGHTLDAATATYVHHPPTSGRHVHTPPATGVSASPIPEAQQVAALERSWVLLQYGPGATSADRAALRRLAGSRVVVAPAVRIDGDRAIAFTAWQHRQLCDHASGRAAQRFVQRFAGKPVE